MTSHGIGLLRFLVQVSSGHTQRYKKNLLYFLYTYLLETEMQYTDLCWF